MHKINITLHNLKTALIFSMEILRDYSSQHGLRTCQITKNVRRSAAEIQGGIKRPDVFRVKTVKLNFKYSSS